jgi:hypothetical protein
MKASLVTSKSTHPSPSVDVSSAPISISHSAINSLATEKLMIQELNPANVGPLAMAGVPPASSSFPLPSINLNLTLLQDAPTPNPIRTASSATPTGGAVQKPADLVASLATPRLGAMAAMAPAVPSAQPSAVVVKPVGTNLDSSVPENAGFLCEPNDTITHADDSTPSYTPHATPPALPLMNPFPFTPSLRISAASPAIPWCTSPTSPVPDISRLHVDTPATPSTAIQRAAVHYDSPHPLGHAVLIIPSRNAAMNTPGTPSSMSDVSMDISSNGKHVNDV